MAGSFESLYEVAFTSTSTVTVTHGLNRVQVAVLVRVGNESRNDLISTVIPNPANPRNEVVVTLTSSQSGSVLVLDTDYLFANIPTPEAAARGDSTIHTNVAGEIASVPAKASPAGADLLLIEDSADGNAKKRVAVSDLPGGGGGITGPGSSVDRGVVVWNGRDSRGRAVASGVYLIRLQTGSRSLIERVTRVSD